MTKVEIPYSYKIINIGKTEGSRREAIVANDGKLAVLGDDHQEGMYLSTGILRAGDRDTYFLETIGEGSDRRLHYHDLTMLAVSFP